MKIRWKRLKGQSHVDPRFARAWNAERRRPRYPDTLVVEAATKEVDADRWRIRLEEWQDRLVLESLGAGLYHFLAAPRFGWSEFP